MTALSKESLEKSGSQNCQLRLAMPLAWTSEFSYGKGSQPKHSGKNELPVSVVTDYYQNERLRSFLILFPSRKLQCRKSIINYRLKIANESL